MLLALRFVLRLWPFLLAVFDLFCLPATSLRFFRAIDASRDSVISIKRTWGGRKPCRHVLRFRAGSQAVATAKDPVRRLPVREDRSACFTRGRNATNDLPFQARSV